MRPSGAIRKLGSIMLWLPGEKMQGIQKEKIAKLACCMTHQMNSPHN